MRLNRRNKVALKIVCALCIVSAPEQVGAQCRPPHFDRGHIWEDSASSVVMNASMRISDFAPERLVCLAGALRQRYSTQRRISVFLFTSETAAKHYTHPIAYPWTESMKPQVDWELREYARYSFDLDKGENAVYIMPFGLRTDFQTKISLPVTTPPQCTLRMNSRCLLAADELEFPHDALAAEVSGSVTLVGSIAANGMLKNVRASKMTFNSNSKATIILVNSSLQNLRSWRLEPSNHADSVLIEYSYIIDPSRINKSTLLNFNLPNKIVIEAGVPK